jgi:hypothetical protein
MSTEHEDMSTERLLVILETAASEVDREIHKWIICPTHSLRRLTESDWLKSILKDEPESIKALDLLMIRVQCAEAFQQVAKEHGKLLFARMQMEK